MGSPQISTNKPNNGALQGAPDAIIRTSDRTAQTVVEPIKDEVVIGDQRFKFNPASKFIPLSGHTNYPVLRIPPQLQGTDYKSSFEYNQDALGTGVYSIDTNGALTGVSGLQISKDNVEKLQRLQDGIMNHEMLYMTYKAELDNKLKEGSICQKQYNESIEVANGRLIDERERRENNQISILQSALGSSPRQAERKRIEADIEKINAQIKTQKVSNEELRQYVEHQVQLERLSDADARERALLGSFLRLNSVQRKNNDTPLSPEDIAEAERLAYIVYEQPAVYGSGIAIDTDDNLKQRSVLDESLRLRNSNPQKQNELTYDIYTLVEANAYSDRTKKSPESLRQDFLVKLVTSNDMPCEEFLEYIRNSKNKVDNPDEKVRIGEAIELAKYIRENEKTHGTNLTPKQKDFINRALEIMSIKPDELTNLNISDNDITQRNLRNAKTIGSTFENSTFTQGVNFTDATLSSLTNVSVSSNARIDPKWITNFSGARFNGAYFSGAKACYCNFTDSELTDSFLLSGDFHNADFTRAHITGSDLHGANMNKGIFSDTIFENVDATRTQLEEVCFKNTNFDKFNCTKDGSKINNPETNFKGSVFFDSHGSKSNFSNCNLNETVIDHSSFENSDFSNANLEQAILYSSEFKSSDFTRANLSSTNISNSTFQDSKFTGTDLSGANIQLSRFDNCNFSNENTTFAGANLDGSSATDSDFSKALFIGTSLINTNFNNCNFKGTNLTGANLQGADLSTIQIDNNTNLRGAIYDDKTKFPGINNNDKTAQAKFAHEHGMLHVDQVLMLEKAQAARRALTALKTSFNKIESGQGWANSTYDYTKNNADTANRIVDTAASPATLIIAKAYDESYSNGLGVFDKEKGSASVNNLLNELEKEVNEMERLANGPYQSENKNTIDNKYKELFGDKMESVMNAPPGERERLAQELAPSKPENQRAMKAQTLKDVGLLGGKFQQTIKQIDGYVGSQQNFGDGCSMVVGTTTYIVCAALAGPTGGASLVLAPGLSAAAVTGFNASNGKGDGTDYSNEELGKMFAKEFAVGVVCLPLSHAATALGRAVVSNGGRYIITKVGGRYIARLAMTRVGQTAGKVIVNSAGYAGGGAGWGFGQGTMVSLINGDPLYTALENGVERAQHLSIRNLILGNVFDAGHAGLKTLTGFQGKVAGNSLKISFHDIRRTPGIWRQTMPVAVTRSRYYLAATKRNASGIEFTVVPQSKLPEGKSAYTETTLRPDGSQSAKIYINEELAKSLANKPGTSAYEGAIKLVDNELIGACRNIRMPVLGSNRDISEFIRNQLRYRNTQNHTKYIETLRNIDKFMNMAARFEAQGKQIEANKKYKEIEELATGADSTLAGEIESYRASKN